MIKIHKSYFFHIIKSLAIVALISICCMIFAKKGKDDALYVYGTASLPIIIIDAGHGGEDSGAIGVNGRYEKDLNLEICNTLANYLRKSGYNVVLTRTEDRLMYGKDENIKGMKKIYDLKNRVKIANSYDNALFISIHMNSFGSSKYSGLQVYYGSEENSLRLAECLQSEVVSRIQNDNNRKIKKGDELYLLENSSNPSVLIECGFLSNPEECQKLSEKEYQKELCFALICGIIKYTEGLSDEIT